MTKFTLSCDQANHVCDKNQYKEATLWEKIKLNIHLIYCRACRGYTKRNMKLSKVLKNNAKVAHIGADAKEQMKSAFEKELAKRN